MFARVSRYTGDASGLRAGFESVAGELDRLQGFNQAFFLTDADSGRAVSIVMFDNRADLDATADTANKMRARAVEKSGTQIDSVESFEVVLTVKAGSRFGKRAAGLRERLKH